jgi:hypothetical protein
MKNRIICFILFAWLGSSCTPEWSKEERDYVYNHCLQMAVQQGFVEPENHCACAVEKFEKASPNPEEVLNLSNEQLVAMATSCQDSLKAIISFKQIFSANCLTMAQQAQVKNPESYCECVVDKIINKYHNQVDMNAVKAEEVQEIGKSCE